MTLGAVLLVAYLGVTGGLDDIAHLSAVQAEWVLATGAILTAYVVTWYNALRLAPATAVTCVLTIGAPITAALDVIAGRGLPSSDEWLAYGIVVPAVGAIALATLGTSRQTREMEATPA
jgi:hypothetical protein